MSFEIEHADVGPPHWWRRWRLKGKQTRPKPDVTHERPILGVEADLHRPPRVRPLPQVFSLRTENLNAAVLAVGNVHQAAAVDGDAVRQVELSRAVSRFGPCEE